MSCTFDKEAFETLAAGDATLARTVADLFRKDSLELVTSLETSLAERDEAAFKRHGHTLKSTCLTVGATGVSAWGEQIEVDGFAVASEMVPMITAGLEDVFSRLEDLVRDLAPA